MARCQMANDEVGTIGNRSRGDLGTPVFVRYLRGCEARCRLPVKSGRSSVNCEGERHKMPTRILDHVIP